ncbi:hypothetical protein ABS71_15425 [bacterium SCN 62-11]|nr:hypothetical protein [Candidatus Eremiobacteraeota bacterium]ODT62649.1 MAG: hypothetical protein ABS71_15425 [bacterium SCN 62-11]
MKIQNYSNSAKLPSRLARPEVAAVPPGDSYRRHTGPYPGEVAVMAVPIATAAATFAATSALGPQMQLGLTVAAGAVGVLAAVAISKELGSALKDWEIKTPDVGNFVKTHGLTALAGAAMGVALPLGAHAGVLPELSTAAICAGGGAALVAAPGVLVDGYRLIRDQFR